MRVIVAGPPKTGTTSTALALRELGYVVYDVDEQLEFQLDAWHDALITGTEPDFNALFAGVDAVTDGPAVCFWEQLFRSFPDAKVVLLTREETSWARSYKNQKAIEWKWRWMTRFNAHLTKIFEVADASEKILMGSEKFIQSTYIRKLRLHNDRVRQVVPNEQLLEFSVHQGWEPLCKFLNADVPECPFPRANVAGQDYETEFRQLRRNLVVQSLHLAAAASCAAVAITVTSRVLFRRPAG